MTTRRPARRSVDWNAVLDRMFLELRSPEPRARAYWAQQVAFAPVLVHALALRMRRGGVPASDLAALGHVVTMAMNLLAALPEPSGGDPAALRILAARQAFALGSGRRTLLRRLADRLGVAPGQEVAGTVPLPQLRSYPLIGWRP